MMMFIVRLFHWSFAVWAGEILRTYTFVFASDDSVAESKRTIAAFEWGFLRMTRLDVMVHFVFADEFGFAQRTIENFLVGWIGWIHCVARYDFIS